MHKVSLEAKAGYLCGLYAGMNSFAKKGDKKAQAYIKRLEKFAITAAQVAFDGGAFNPLDVWEMEAEYDRIEREAARQYDLNTRAGG